MMSSLRSLILIALCLPMTIACSRRETTKRPHDKAVAVEATASKREVQTREAAIRMAEIAKGASNLKATASQLLSASVLEDGKILASAEARERLGALNQSVAALLDKAEKTGDADDAAPELKELLDLYSNAFLIGCDEALRGCQTVSFFKQDHNSSRIARAMGDRQKDVSKAYRFYRLAYAFKSTGPVLDAAYLKRARSHYDTLVAKGDADSRKLAKEHLELVTSILTGLAAKPDAKIDASLLADFKPWDFGRVRNPELARVDELVLALSSRSMIGTPEFQSKLEALKAEEGAITKKMMVLNSAQPYLFKTLGLPQTLTMDEYLFIFDQLYMGRMSVEDASHIWKGTKQDIPRARATFENYVRARLALSISDGNRTMQEFFRSQGQFTSSSVIVKSIEESLKIEMMWSNTYKRMDQLKVFADRHFRDGTDEARKTEHFFSGLARNVKFLSTYPTMLVMCYHLARLDASIRFHSPIGPIELKATDIINAFFDGRYKPWFNFSADTLPLKKTELYQVFIFTLRTGMLAGAGISYKDFFKLISERSLADFETKIPRFNSSLRKSFDKRPQYQEFRRVCERMKSGGQVFENNMPLERLHTFTVVGIPDVIAPANMSATLASAWYLYDTDREGTMWQMSEIVEIARLEFSARLDQMKLFAGLLNEYVKETEGLEAAEKTRQEISAILAPYEDRLRELYGYFFRFHKEISDCVHPMIDLEFAGQAFLVRAFSAHLREVHVEMTKLQGSPSEDLIPAFRLAKQTGLDFPGLEGHEASLGISSRKYRLSQVQVLLRFKQALEKGSRTEKGFEGPLRPEGTIALPENIRVMSDSMSGRIVDIPYNADADAFVASGLRALFAHRESLASWFDISYAPGAYIRSLKILTALYKLGEVNALICQDGDCKAQKSMVTAEELLKASVHMIRRLELDPEWAKILRLIGRPSRYPVSIYLEDWAYKRDDRSPMGLFDYPFSLVRKSYLEDQAPPGFAPIRPVDEAKSYFKSTLTPGANVFPLPEAFTSLLEKHHTDLVKAELKKQIDFMRLARKIGKSNKDLPAWRFTLRDLNASAPTALSESIVDNFRGELLQFEKETGRSIMNDILSEN